MNMSRLWSPVTRWGEFRRRQLAALEESNRIAAQVQRGRPRARGGGDRPGPDAGAEPVGTAPEPMAGPVAPGGPAGAPGTYGIIGRPLNRHSPFYIGFLGATGALLAIGLWQLVGAALDDPDPAHRLDVPGAGPQPDRRRPRRPRGAPVGVGHRGVHRAARRLRGHRLRRHPTGGGTGHRAGPAGAQLHRGPPRQHLGARARQELRRHRQGARRGAGPDDRPAVPRGRARRPARCRPGRAQRGVPGLHRARADAVLPLLAPPRQARRVRRGAGQPPAPGRVALRGDHAAHRVLRHRPGRHRHAQRAAVVRDDAHRRHPVRRGARGHRRPARASSR